MGVLSCKPRSIDKKVEFQRVELSRMTRTSFLRSLSSPNPLVSQNDAKRINLVPESMVLRTNFMKSWRR